MSQPRGSKIGIRSGLILASMMSPVSTTTSALSSLTRFTISMNLDLGNVLPKCVSRERISSFVFFFDYCSGEEGNT